MKIIYDKDAALKQKAELDAKVENDNKEAKTNNKRILQKSIISTVLFLLVAVPLAIWMCSDFEDATITTWGLFFFCGTFLFCVTFYAHLNWEAYWEEGENYTPAVKYLLATQGYNILETGIKTSSDSDICTVFVVLEDENHIVSKKTPCQLKLVTSTAYERETADINAGYYYLPYCYCGIDKE